MPQTVTLLVFGTLLYRGTKAILRTGLNLSSLGPVNLTIGKFSVACHRDQSSGLFSSFFYINDLPDVSSLTLALLFADDTNIFCSHRNTDHLVSIANLTGCPVPIFSCFLSNSYFLLFLN